MFGQVFFKKGGLSTQEPQVANTSAEAHKDSRDHSPEETCRGTSRWVVLWTRYEATIAGIRNRIS